jgi:hypothetical protein
MIPDQKTSFNNFSYKKPNKTRENITMPLPKPRMRRIFISASTIIAQASAEFLAFDVLHINALLEAFEFGSDQTKVESRQKHWP